MNVGSGMCYNCRSLSSVTIGSGVTSIGNAAFAQCTSLTNLTIPLGVTTIGQSAFRDCSGLTSVTIPNSVISIDSYAFEYCYALTNVTIGSGVTSIGNGAFYNCSGLTSINIDATRPPTLGNSAFFNTNNCPIYIPCESIDAYKFASGWSTYTSRFEAVPPCYSPIDGKWLAIYTGDTTSSAQCDSTSAITSGEVTTTGLRNIVIGNCVTTIGNFAFQNSSNLTTVTIPDSVTGIGGYAFYYCRKLIHITIPDSVTSIGYASFNGCTDLTSIVVEATTPPTLDSLAFNNTNDCPIYVPSASVNAYKSATRWSSYSSRIKGY